MVREPRFSRLMACFASSFRESRTARLRRDAVDLFELALDDGFERFDAPRELFKLLLFILLLLLLAILLLLLLLLFEVVVTFKRELFTGVVEEAFKKLLLLLLAFKLTGFLLLLLSLSSVGETIKMRGDFGGV